MGGFHKSFDVNLQKVFFTVFEALTLRVRLNMFLPTRPVSCWDTLDKRGNREEICLHAVLSRIAVQS